MTESERVFLAYTGPYRAYGEKIILKIDHTLRVEGLCREIARSLGLDAGAEELAAACGLFHDIGRFEQWKRYGTYDDKKSADHGALGAEILKSGRLLDGIPEPGRTTVIRTARYHNRYRVPDTLSERNRLFAHLVRDADKIDILDLLARKELAVHTRGSAVSGTVCRALLDGKPVRRQDTRTRADGAAVCLGFIPDLRYRRSFEIVLEKNLVDRVIEMMSEEASSAELDSQLEAFRSFLNGYVRRKASCGG
jgi:putative nucleotidyltransferase with HDIG domain